MLFEHRPNDRPTGRNRGPALRGGSGTQPRTLVAAEIGGGVACIVGITGGVKRGPRVRASVSSGGRRNRCRAGGTDPRSDIARKQYYSCRIPVNFIGNCGRRQGHGRRGRASAGDVGFFAFVGEDQRVDHDAEAEQVEGFLNNEADKRHAIKCEHDHAADHDGHGPDDSADLRRKNLVKRRPTQASMTVLPNRPAIKKTERHKNGTAAMPINRDAEAGRATTGNQQNAQESR